MKTEHSVLKVILHTVKQNKRICMTLFASVMGSAGFALLPPLILAKAIDCLTSDQAFPLALALSYFGLLLLTNTATSLRESLLTIFGQRITHKLRTVLCQKVSHLPADAFVSHDSGAIASRFVGDVDTVEELFTSGIISMFTDTCQLCGIFFVIFAKNRGLAILLLFVLPVVFFYTRHVQKCMLASQLNNRAAIAKAAGHVPETLRCIRTIHNLHKEMYMEEKYSEFLEDSYKAVDKTNFYDAVYSPVILISNALTIAIVMVLSSLKNGEVQLFFGMSAGTAAAVISYITQVFTPLESIGMEIQTIQSAAAGVHRINEFLDLPERKIAAEHIAENNLDPFFTYPIEFQNVTFRYEENDPNIFQGLSFSIKEGEHVTLTGRTGAGKSTIFKLLLGLYDPQEGQVLIQGQPASALSDSQRRKIISCVEQNFSLVPGTIRDQITLFDPAISNEQAQYAAQLTGLDEVIGHFPDGYDTPCRPDFFSQGQWQLISIARAVAANPRILLLDEITANLDANTEKNVLAALDRAGNGRTVLSISHRLYESLNLKGQSSGRQIAIDRTL
ncbi:MAG: ABC transporter ATP-binding protein [Enterocloster sp.]